MTFWEIFIIAIGLSMDAFAVALCKGIKMRPFSVKKASIIAIFFGVAQALMPLIGWFLGKQFESYIVPVDHWIAFGLLAFIGGKMIFDVIRGGDECEDCGCFDIKELFIMAIATSIDALATGIAIACSGDNIWLSITMIGVVTFAMCVGGVFVGNKFGTKYKDKATVAGGIILLLIGLKILLEHLGVINF